MTEKQEEATRIIEAIGTTTLKEETYKIIDSQGNEVLPCVMPSFDSPKNWTEDYKHENGNYICRCSKCKEYFYGHKRRPLCKECGS